MYNNCVSMQSCFQNKFSESWNIGIIPPHGYRPEKKQSVMAYQWLTYFSHIHDVYIQHGRNNGEKQIGPYKVDGYNKTEQGIEVALKFHGCFWHGRPRCFLRDTINPVCEITMAKL